MDLCIIADDLTGANDSGVQLLDVGYNPTVLVDGDLKGLHKHEVVVVDTDSRADASMASYHKVKQVMNTVQQYLPDVVYKKIDSTMRGNIGAELDAIYDTCSPDFIVINPAYPSAGRFVKNGELYVKDKPLDRSHIKNYPGPPFDTASIKTIINRQSAHDLWHGSPDWTDKQWKDALKKNDGENKRYITFDAKKDEDIERVVQVLTNSSYRFSWAGSAGLMPSVAKACLSQEKNETDKTKMEAGRFLFTIGSINQVTRLQLEQLKKADNMCHIAVHPTSLLFDYTETWNDVKRQFEKGANGKHVVLYTLYDEDTWESLQHALKKRNMEIKDASREIANALGNLVKQLRSTAAFKWYFLSGGDIAKAVCRQNKWDQLKLIDELENGIPIGQAQEDDPVFVITKAGGFGGKDVFLHALEKSERGVLY
ncbi:four-carbon acid sugar kinase family protein [Alteribacillus bidgolensis]|uniref:Uncharacterized conserved protein YgbK, DUF1537 family n=1 Tax=Alteribacillus bidgolensis TaxID=930129 RepID=A0A1G8NHU2_9BACI|nr:four-carbon acid sugar kinase family protein [Alteribacillus bidgolensis]SDI79657.1 Uncharacterized conserved protein YgbK, DUF1537 family [Alteribacillus bidgolensis]